MRAITFATTLSLVLLIAGCATSPRPIATAGQVQHVELFWLKPGGDREAIFRSANDIGTIPGVIDVAVGERRPSALDNFDAAMIVTLLDELAYEKLRSHPTFKRVVDNVWETNAEFRKSQDIVLRNYLIGTEVDESLRARRIEAMRKQRNQIDQAR